LSWHTGASALELENTLAAFRAAIRLGADFIEFDVRRTKDKVLVIHHDPRVFDKIIKDSSLAELRKAAQANRTELATFDQLLQVAHRQIKLDIEIKEESYEMEIINSLRSHGWSDDDFVITSFHDASIRRIKLYSQTARCGLLLGVSNPPNRLSTRLSEFFPAQRLKATGADFVAPSVQLLKFAFARRLTAKGFPIWVWTVDNPRRIQRLLATRGVEAVITNAPDLGLKAREQLQEKLSRYTADPDEPVAQGE